MSCPRTAVEGFPHHWKCIEPEGHSDCSCHNKGRFCKAYECRLEDGTRRVPDGSIAAKEHLENGGLAIRTIRFGKE